MSMMYRYPSSSNRSAWALTREGLEKAVELLRRFLSIREVTLGPKDVPVGATLHQPGVLVQKVGCVEKAEECLT